MLHAYIHTDCQIDQDGCGPQLNRDMQCVCLCVIVRPAFFPFSFSFFSSQLPKRTALAGRKPLVQCRNCMARASVGITKVATTVPKVTVFHLSLGADVTVLGDQLLLHSPPSARLLGSSQQPGDVHLHSRSANFTQPKDKPPSTLHSRLFMSLIIMHLSPV